MITVKGIPLLSFVSVLPACWTSPCELPTDVLNATHVQGRGSYFSLSAALSHYSLSSLVHYQSLHHFKLLVLSQICPFCHLHCQHTLRHCATLALTLSCLNYTNGLLTGLSGSSLIPRHPSFSQLIGQLV